MDHRPQRRIVPGARTAVLFVHGIAGTPDHFDPLIPLLPPEWSFSNLLLAGHGKGVEEFSATSMKAWRAQVLGEIDRLRADHRQVLLVGHSMGTLLSIEAAVQDPTRIGGLFLLAVPLKWRLGLPAVTNSLKVVFGRVREDDVRALATKRASSIRHDPRVWKYIGWIPRFLELFAQMRTVRRLLPCLTVEAEVLQSRQDELVSRASERYLRDHLYIHLTVLPHSAHYYYAAEDFSTITAAFGRFCEEHRL